MKCVLLVGNGGNDTVFDTVHALRGTETDHEDHSIALVCSIEGFFSFCSSV